MVDTHIPIENLVSLNVISTVFDLPLIFTEPIVIFGLYTALLSLISLDSSGTLLGFRNLVLNNGTYYIPNRLPDGRCMNYYG